jgi:aminoglycoside phosphotransferase (APT) family kinase protein
VQTRSVADHPGALVRWLEERFGGPVTTVAPTTTNAEGFDSEIHFLHLSGPALPAEWRAPIVLRVKSDADRLAEAEREAAIQAWLADRGYPAPRVLHVFAPGELLDRPAQVMERAGGVMMLDRVRRAPWSTRQLLARLAALQARLHRLTVDGFPAGDDLVDHRLRLPRRVAAELDHRGLTVALERIDLLAESLRDAPPSVCHGDFHPLNVIVDGDDASVVDWTDTGIGDRHGDVARTVVLLEVAWIAAGGTAERAALRVLGPRLARRYRRSYEEHLPLEPDRLARWVPLHLVHGWSQAVALHAGLFDRGPDVDDDRTARAPFALAEELERRTGAALDALA